MGWSGREYWTSGWQKRTENPPFSVLESCGRRRFLIVIWEDYTVTVCVAVTRLLSRGQRLKTQRVNKLYDEHKLRLSDPTSQLLTLNSSYTVSYQHNDPPLPRKSFPRPATFIFLYTSSMYTAACFSGQRGDEQHAGNANKPFISSCRAEKQPTLRAFPKYSLLLI